MSDIFNPNHYLDLNLLKKEGKDTFSLDLNNLYLLRKKQFPSFNFIIFSNESILFSELNINDNNLKIENSSIYVIREINKNSFLNIQLNGKSNIIIEDIANKKNESNIHINSQGQNNFYYFTNYSLEDLFYSNININIEGKLKSLIITKPQIKKHKNNIQYFLSNKSEIEHNQFTENFYGQLQDDSIEITHKEKSISKINYISLNSGKISTQINSIIPFEANNCETTQLISHLVLEPNAVTKSKPNLVIKNKNVVASHGNNIGGFSQEDLFYLKQRGIKEERAKKILAKSKYLSIIENDSLRISLIKYYEDKNE